MAEKTLAASDTLSNTINSYIVAERDRTSQNESGAARQHYQINAFRSGITSPLAAGFAQLAASSTKVTVR